jgi:hypothetical protein
MNQDKTIFMSQAFQKSPFGGLTSLRASPFRGTHFLIKTTKYWFLFYHLNQHSIYFSFLNLSKVNQKTSILIQKTSLQKK